MGVIGNTSEKVWEDGHRKVNLFGLISVHTMLLLGIVLLFLALGNVDFGEVMKNSVLRKQYVEHPFMGVLAAVFVTIGNAKSKKAIGNGKKFKATMLFYGLALIVVLSRLPFEKLF